jgi:NADPH:quinone reductase-like Zn-dependent oxidoreductase
MTTMRAVFYEKFGPPEVLQLKEVPRPIPAEGELLIQVHATSVVKEEPDWRRSPGFNGFFKPRNPILGQEFAGVVVEVGNGVSLFQPGDQVYGYDSFGAYAEYKTIAEKGALVQKPANVTYEQAASIPNGALTALPFLRDRGEIQQGQKVLIYGASGSVGSAAVQIAKSYGAEVTGVCSTANLDWVAALGAKRVIDYTQEDFTQTSESFDIVFDTVGKTNFNACKHLLEPDGIYLTTVPTPGVMLQALRSSFGSGKKVRTAAAGLRSASLKVKDLTFLNGLIEAGHFKAVIDRTYPLDQMAEAHRYVEAGHKKGNVVITVISTPGEQLGGV